ncbi:MAG: sigma-70 family RNA polymerase sigma factor [Lunatimonas sp.]|nr:sigma-70 family RNA polymerase sigma factor [Lunatimonas sp.]
MKNQEPIPDKDLWQMFKKGNESAFISLYQTYFESLFSYGKKLTKNEALLKDAIQDLFIYLRANRATVGDVENIKFYLFKSLKNRILKEEKKWYKYIHPIEADFDLEFHPSPEQVLISRQIDENQVLKINQALGQLSARKKEAIYYLYFEGMDYTQVQHLMNMSNVKSARNLIYKALKQLRAALE